MGVYIIIISFLFFLSFMGMFLFRKHIINILICLELLILSINWNFVVFSYFLDDIMGQIYCLLILTVGAAESSLGLAILIIYYKRKGGIILDSLNLLKG